MKKCKGLLFLSVLIALLTVVPAMAECVVRPKGCTQLYDGEEIYVKFWSRKDCLDIMGREFADSCIITSKPIGMRDGDLFEKSGESDHSSGVINKLCVNPPSNEILCFIDCGSVIIIK